MKELYNPNKQSSYIIMMDMNNLYGRAMIDYLPQNLNILKKKHK